MPKSPLDEVDMQMMSVADRLDLIGQLWDSISLDDHSIPNWHVLEIERRVEAADASPEAAVPWEQVRERLRDGQ